MTDFQNGARSAGSPEIITGLRISTFISEAESTRLSAAKSTSCRAMMRQYRRWHRQGSTVRSRPDHIAMISWRSRRTVHRYCQLVRDRYGIAVDPVVSKTNSPLPAFLFESAASRCVDDVTQASSISVCQQHRSPCRCTPQSAEGQD